jgi:hypothetical protein
VSFTSTNGLSRGNSTITLQAPVGFVFPAQTCPGYVLSDATTQQMGACAQASILRHGREVTVTSTLAVNPGDFVTLVANDVANSTHGGRYQLTLSTSSDPLPEELAFNLRPETPVLYPQLQAIPGAQHAYNVSFISADGLTGGLSTISISSPVALPAAGCQAYVFVDATTRQSSGCLTVTLSTSGTQAIMVAPRNVSPGDRINVRVNSGSLVPPASVRVSTTSDPRVVGTGRQNAWGLQLSSYSTKAVKVTYTVSFNAAATSTGATTITLSAPRGTSFPVTTGCGSSYVIYDLTTGQTDGCATTTVLGPGHVSLATNLKIALGDVVTVAADGAGNPTSTGGMSLRATASSGAMAQSLRYSLTPEASVQSPVSRLTSYATLATEVTYDVSFISTDGLSGAGVIRFTPVGGIRLPKSGCGIYVVYDASTGASDGCPPAKPINGGHAVDIGIGGLSINPGDAVTVVINGMANTPRSLSNDMFLATSSDPVPVSMPLHLTRTTGVG